MSKIKKIIMVLKRIFISQIAYFNADQYMKSYNRYLQRIGVDFTGTERKCKMIDPTAYFDGTDYSKIHLGDNITISKEVMLLTHDYSLNTALCSIGQKIDRHAGEYHFLRDIQIGDNCFIGARASLLPGTVIEKNCIIGSCAVVKGYIPENSIVVGNPCKIIGKTDEYARKHIRLKDYEIEKG